MINLYGAQIAHISVHKVGNSSRGEGVFLSEAPLHLNDETHALLKEYFFKSFREKEEHYYHFSHEVDRGLNFIYDISIKMFLSTFSSNIHLASRHISNYLYKQAKHPHIKSGDLYVCYITDILLDNKKVDAIGIFKSEIKHDFIQLEEKGNSIDMVVQQGININKLDKGCLILNTDAENGFKVLSVDNNRYDAKYWLDNFLGLETLSDSNHKTKKYLKFCQDFAKDVVAPSADRQQEVLFMNRAVNHFAKNDQFNEADFLADTLQNPELLPEFAHYKTEKAPKYGLEDTTGFEISNTAVTAARKKIKNTIHLDTNITIKMDFINPESAEKFLEKGWDEERQMYYYLVYFNKEQK